MDGWLVGYLTNWLAGYYEDIKVKYMLDITFKYNFTCYEAAEGDVGSWLTVNGSLGNLDLRLKKEISGMN